MHVKKKKAFKKFNLKLAPGGVRNRPRSQPCQASSTIQLLVFLDTMATVRIGVHRLSYTCANVQNGQSSIADCSIPFMPILSISTVIRPHFPLLSLLASLHHESLLKGHTGEARCTSLLPM